MYYVSLPDTRPTPSVANLNISICPLEQAELINFYFGSGKHRDITF